MDDEQQELIRHSLHCLDFNISLLASFNGEALESVVFILFEGCLCENMQFLIAYACLNTYVGFICRLQGHSASAIHSLEKAYSILQVTHGSKSSLLQSLTSTLQEAHAEVAYKGSLIEQAH